MESKTYTTETVSTVESGKTPTIERETEGVVAYQGIGRRAVAIVADSIVLFAVNVALTYLVAAAIGGITPTGFSVQGAPAFVLMALYLAIGFGYFIALESRNGQTLGKRLVGIRVVKEDGSPCDLSAATVRNVLRVVDGIFVYAVGAVFVALSEKKQRLGDRLANTVVVRA